MWLGRPLPGPPARAIMLLTAIVVQVNNVVMLVRAGFGGDEPRLRIEEWRPVGVLNAEWPGAASCF